jgi:hypothetical protein
LRRYGHWFAGGPKAVKVLEVYRKVRLEVFVRKRRKRYKDLWVLQGLKGIINHLSEEHMA